MDEESLRVSLSVAKDPKERARLRARIWRLHNLERDKANCKAWRERNPERAKSNIKRWAELNPEKHRAYKAKWAAANPEHCKANLRNRRSRKASAAGRHTPCEIATLAKRQEFKCANCRSSIKDQYEADHIMPLALGGSNEISNIQLLCRSCNRRKSKKHPVAWAQENGRLL